MENQEKLKSLKSLLGVVDESKDTILNFVINKTKDTICNYCKVKDVPPELITLQLNMCVEVYRAEGFGKEALEGTIKSISEGDVSIAFASSTSANENPSMEFLKNYKVQLDMFRKAGW